MTARFGSQAWRPPNFGIWQIVGQVVDASQEGTFVDHSQPTLSYSDFIEKDLLHRESAQTLMLIRTRQELSSVCEVRRGACRAAPSSSAPDKPHNNSQMFSRCKVTCMCVCV